MALQAEVKAFKELFTAWLTSIEELAAIVGTHIYCKRPTSTSRFPCLVWNFITRKPALDPFAGKVGWNGMLVIRLGSPDDDVLDQMEAAILEALGNATPDITAVLSNAVIGTGKFEVVQVEDSEEVMMLTENLVADERDIFCNVVFYPLPIEEA